MKYKDYYKILGVDRANDPLPDRPASPSMMFFYAYCAKAIEMHMQDHELPAETGSEIN